MKITYEIAVQELLRNIPEIKTRRDFDPDELNSPTIVFDEFGDFLLDKIKSSSIEDPVIKRSFDFINQMMDSDIPDVQNLPIVGVFEVLVASKVGIQVAEQLLNEEGMSWFAKVKDNFEAV